MSSNWVTAVAPEAGLGRFLFKTAGAQGVISAAFPTLSFVVCVLGFARLSMGEMRRWWVLAVLRVSCKGMP